MTEIEAYAAGAAFARRCTEIMARQIAAWDRALLGYFQGGPAVNSVGVSRVTLSTENALATNNDGTVEQPRGNSGQPPARDS